MQYSSSWTQRDHKNLRKRQHPSIPFNARGEGSSAIPRKQFRGSPQPRAPAGDSLVRRLTSRGFPTTPFGFSGFPTTPSTDKDKGSSDPFGFGTVPGSTTSSSSSSTNKNPGSTSGNSGSSSPPSGNSGSTGSTTTPNTSPNPAPAVPNNGAGTTSSNTGSSNSGSSGNPPVGDAASANVSSQANGATTTATVPGGATTTAQASPSIATISPQPSSHSTSGPSTIGNSNSGNNDGSNTAPPDTGNLSSGHGASTGLVAGLSILAVILLAALVVFCVRRRSRQRRNERSRSWWFGRNRDSGESYHSEGFTQSSVMDLTPSGLTSDPLGARSRRSSFATTVENVPQLAMPPMAELRDDAGISHLFGGAAFASSTGHAFSHEYTHSPHKTIGSRASANLDDPEPESQYLYVRRPVSQASVDSQIPSPMSVRPFSVSESFAFPKPPSQSSGSPTSDSERGSWAPAVRNKAKVFNGSTHTGQGSKSTIVSMKAAVHGAAPSSRSGSSTPNLDLRLPSPMDFSSSRDFPDPGAVLNRADYRTSQVDPFADPRRESNDLAYGAIYLEGFESVDAVGDASSSAARPKLPRLSAVAPEAPAIPPRTVAKRSTISTPVRSLFIPPSPSIPPPSVPLPYTPTPTVESNPSSHGHQQPLPPSPVLPINKYAPVEVVVRAHLASHPGPHPYPTIEFGVNVQYEELSVNIGDYVRVSKVLEGREWVLVQTVRDGITQVKEGVIPADSLRKLEAIPVEISPFLAPSELEAVEVARVHQQGDQSNLATLVRADGKWVTRA